ncbi:MAG TPA: hypothetical protein VN231_08250 [Allosphingosinicella sp.]|nr:hypothetical protein [Allosphingosinicella sp.]
MSVTLEQARAVKKKAGALAGQIAEVVGVGLTSRGGSFAVKVNLRTAAGEALPDEVDGVPIVYEVVGTIRPRLP